MSLAAKSLEDGALKKCSHCNGKGVITVSVKVGERREGYMTYPIMEDQQQKCTSCNGTGITRSTPEALERLCSTLATSIAGLKKSEKQERDRLKFAYLSVGRFLKDPTPLAQVTERTRSLLVQHDIKSGTALTSSAIYGGSIDLGDPNGRVHVALIGDGQLVLMTTPIAFDEMTVGKVFIGGLCAGTTKSRDGREILVLQNGFIFNVNGAGDLLRPTN